MTRERRFILISGATLLFLGLIYRLFPGMTMPPPTVESIRMKEKQLARYHQKLQEKDVLQQQLVAVKQEIVRSEAALLAADTSALAAVEIQNILNEIADRSRIKISTMRVLSAKEMEDSAFVSIPVQVTFDCTIRQLKEILYRIESSPKLLLISEFRTRLNQKRGFEKIQTTLTVKGFMAKETG